MFILPPPYHIIGEKGKVIGIAWKFRNIFLSSIYLLEHPKELSYYKNKIS
jgi:hypothetical protein